MLVLLYGNAAKLITVNLQAKKQMQEYGIIKKNIDFHADFIIKNG